MPNLAVATDLINRHQTQWIVKILENLPTPPKKVGILGLAYKAGTNVIEQSQGIALASELLKKGFNVAVYDPMAMEPARSMLGNQATYANSGAECIDHSDGVVIMTAWPEFKDLDETVFSQKKSDFTIIDCWRCLDQHSLKAKVNLINLGQGSLSPKKATQYSYDNAI